MVHSLIQLSRKEFVLNSSSDRAQIQGVYFHFQSDTRQLATHLSLMTFSQEAAVAGFSSYFSVGKVLFTFYWPSIRVPLITDCLIRDPK